MKTPRLMRELRLDRKRQIIGARCSGVLVLAKLGLLDNVPACTDYVAPVGQKDDWVARARAVLDPYL